MPHFLTVPEAAELLRLTDRTVYDLCRQAKLPGAAKIGGQWRIDKDKLLAWLAEGGQAAEEWAQAATDDDKGEDT